MKLLKDYESSSLTLKRVREVIDRALDELEYDSRFDVNVAAENAYYYLAHTACWDEDLAAFQAQLDNGCGPDDGAGALTAYERVEILAAQVERLLNDKETYAYSKTKMPCWTLLPRPIQGCWLSGQPICPLRISNTSGLW